MRNAVVYWRVSPAAVAHTHTHTHTHTHKTQALQDMTLPQLLSFFKGPPNTHVSVTVSSPSPSRHGGDAVPPRSPRTPPPQDTVGNRFVGDSPSSRSPPHTASPVIPVRSSAQSGAWGSGVERHANSEALAASERQPQRGLERGAGTDAVDEIKVRLRGKAPIELGVDAWML